MSENEIKPVAIVGPTYSLAWAGRGPLVYLVNGHGIKVGQGLYSQRDIDRLTAERDALRQLAFCAYQMAGVHDAPEAWLDALCHAANGEEFSADGLLPYAPEAVCNAESQLAECRADAERLDSGMIRLSEWDEFGDLGFIVYSKVDLRAAIDAARAEVK